MGHSSSDDITHELRARCDALEKDNARLKEQLREMENRAHHDVLTGLANRRFFSEGLKLRIMRCQRYGDKSALLFLDVDDLKQVNDHHGHQAGDLVLTRLAEILKSNVRATDMVARIGGDEFAILLDNIDPSNVERKIASLTALIEEGEIEFGQDRINLSAAIGHCLIEPDDSVDDLMSRADAAMYKEKRKVS